jgi:pyrimidine operon attenuation protein/uracil phosphoribosyltransferase
MSKTIILTQDDITNKIRRIAYQIYEVNINEKEVIIAGIENKGFVLAKKIAAVLITISNIKIKLCSVKINKKVPLNAIITSLDSSEYSKKSVILVDDVLNSGTTLMYAVRHFLDVPLKLFKTAVLVDRNHKKYPVKVDFKGISLSTSLQDTVKVVFSNEGDQAYLE